MLVSAEEIPEQYGSDRSEQEQEHITNTDFSELRSTFPVSLRKLQLKCYSVMCRDIRSRDRYSLSVTACLKHGIVLIGGSAVRARINLRLAEISFFRKVDHTFA